MPLTDLFALFQSDPVVLLAEFLSSLCLLLLITGPNLVRASYRKQLLRVSGDAGAAGSEELHRDPPDAASIPCPDALLRTAEQRRANQQVDISFV